MKRNSVLSVRLAFCFAAILLPGSAQTSVQTSIQTSVQTAPATQNPAYQSTPAPHGTILFKRDQDAPAPTDNHAEKTAPARTQEPIPNITDAERTALTFTAYDLDVHLTPAKSSLAVRAKFIVRNTGGAPLARLFFQLSSSLHWDSFAIENAGRVASLAFAQHTLDTDADHTGKATEAVVSLPQPLAPGATAALTSFYSGEIAQSGNRLERIGAPKDQAAAADWDRIAPERTALRGFGNVLWYPTAAAPVFLGDGAKLFQSVGRQRRRQADASMHLRLAIDYTGDTPDAAFFCGRREPLTAVRENTGLPVAQSPGVATADFASRRLGFRTPSLFLTDRAGTVTGDSLISAVTDHYDALPNYDAAAEKVRPLLQAWIGPGPLRMLNIIDLLNIPDHPAQPFEDDALLVSPMRAADPALLAPPLLHSLTHAWFTSSHVWLDEGVPQFLSLLWTEQTQGREAAIQQLDREANTLALAEPAVARDAPDDTGQGLSQSLGQSLIGASDEIYYRTKAASVLWMLRSIVGDDALKRALQLYRNDARQDADPKEFQRVLERAAQRDLNWFFDDWVYRDRGLPDLAIASVTPRALEEKQEKADKKSWLVAVEVRNDGGAAAEVPVTVRSGALTETERLRIAGHSSASIRVVFQGIPQEVIVNDGSVPEATSATHTRQLLVR